MKLLLFISLILVSVVSMATGSPYIGAAGLIGASFTLPGTPGVFFSTVAGVFDETRLLAIRAMAEQMGMDVNIKKQWLPWKNILDAVFSNALPRVTPLQSTMKDNLVEIEWPNTCEIIEDTFSNCEFCGPQGSTNITQMELQKVIAVPWTEYENTYLTNDFEINQLVAKEILKADTIIIQNLAQYLVAILNGALGINAYTAGRGQVTGNITYIAPAYWDAQAIAYMIVAAQQNQMTTPYLIDGGNFAEKVITLGLSDPNQQNSLMNALKYYEDIFNISAVNGGAFGTRTYMIQPGALAFAQKTYYDRAVRIEGEHKRMTMQSPLFPQLAYDFYEKTSCDTEDGHKKFKHCFQLTWHGDFFTSPVGCDEGQTGILGFECGTP